MESIYSRIIWHELGLKDYEIHKSDREKTQNLILDWIKSTPLEKVNEVLFDISWIDRIVNDGYYDGQFYGINQRDKDNQHKVDGECQSDIVIHDCGILPSILHLAIKSKICPEQLIFLAKILDAYLEKIPKDEDGKIVQIETEEGEEF